MHTESNTVTFKSKSICIYYCMCKKEVNYSFHILLSEIKACVLKPGDSALYDIT